MSNLVLEVIALFLTLLLGIFLLVRSMTRASKKKLTGIDPNDKGAYRKFKRMKSHGREVSREEALMRIGTCPNCDYKNNRVDMKKCPECGFSLKEKSGDWI